MSLEILEARQALASFSFSGGVATLTLGGNETGVLNGNIVTASGGVAVDMTTLGGLTTFNVVGDNAGNETFTLSNPLDIAATSIGANVDTLNVNGAIGSGSQSLQYTGVNVQLVGGTTLNLTILGLGAGTSINGNGSLSITTTSALSLNDVGVATPLAGFTITAPSLNLNGDVTVVGLLDVNTSTVNLTDDVAINAGNLNFDAGAAINGAKSLSITTGSNFTAPTFGNTTPLTSLSITSAGNLVVSGSISAATLKVHAGTDGTDKITASAGVTITAGVQSYIAGDGPGGANGAFVDLSTNAPTFAGAITDFRVEVDAASGSNMLPTAAQFSTARPTNYTVISRAGGVVILSGDGSRVSNSAGGTLLLSGLGSVTLLDSIDRGAGTILLQSTGFNVTQNASSVVTAGTISARASSGIALDAATNSASSIALQSNTGDVRYKGQGSFTLSQVAASADYAGSAGMRSNTGNIRIQSTTAGALVSQTSASPVEGNGLELVGNNAAFQLAAASNQIVTIAGSAGAAGISQIIFRDTSGNLDVGAVGATSSLSAGIGIALQSDSGAITQSQSVATADFGVVAATGINLGTQTNNIGELSARTTAGDVRFKNQSALVIGSVGSGLGFGGSSGVSTPGLFSLQIAAAGAAVTQNVTRTINAASVELLGPVDFNLGTNANAAGALAVGGGATSVTFRNSGNLNIDTVDGTAGVTAATVKLQSDSGDLTQSATGVIAATTLSVQAQTNITLDAVDNNVLTLAMGTTAAGAIAFKNNSGVTLTIGTVGAVTGIGSAAAGTSFSVTTADDLNVAAPVQTTGGLKLNSVHLTSLGGGVSQAATAPIRATTLGVQAQGDVSLAGRVEVGLGDATVTAGGAFDLTGVLALTIAAANDFSDLDVTASLIDLTDADLELAGSYAPVAGNAFAIVTGANQTGTFDGQAQNSVLTFNGATLRFNYAAASVTLMTLVAPTITSADATTFTSGTAGSFALTANGFPAPVFSLTSAPAWLSVDGTGNLVGTPPDLGAGPYTFNFDVVASNSVAPDATQSFTLTVNQAPTITSVNATTFTSGTAGSFALTANGFPAPVFSLTNAPAWLSVDGTGNLVGTPPDLGAGPYIFGFDVVASNGIAPDATQSFTLTVNQIPAFTSPDAATFTAGTADSFQVSTTGHPTAVLSLAAGQLPIGVRFDSATGTLAGTPGQAGTFTLTLRATNTAGTTDQPFTLTILPVLLTATGTANGGGPRITVHNPDGSVRYDFFAFDPAFRGGVNVAVADVNGDGIDDIVAGAGATGAPHVKVFDGATGHELSSYYAFDSSLRGGVSVGAADWNGDGVPDIVTGAGVGGAPHVKVFALNGQVLASFFAFEPNFRGGVNVTSGDLTGDGLPDLVLGAGMGGGPVVTVFDGATGNRLNQFFAGPESDRGGVRVAIRDLDGDKTNDLATRAGGVTRVFDPLTGDDLTGGFTAEQLSGVFVG